MGFTLQKFCKQTDKKTLTKNTVGRALLYEKSSFIPAEFFSKGDAVLLLSPNKSLLFHIDHFCVLGRLSAQIQETFLLKVTSCLEFILGKV